MFNYFRTYSTISEQSIYLLSSKFKSPEFDNGDRFRYSKKLDMKKSMEKEF